MNKLFSFTLSLAFLSHMEDVLCNPFAKQTLAFAFFSALWLHATPPDLR